MNPPSGRVPLPLLIFGASTRSAAQSAIRAGYQPIGGDLFADADLRACADVLSVPDYPAGLAVAAESLAPCEWIYVGGLENSPAEIAEISQRHVLLGNGPDVLENCRDPERIVQILQAANCPVLRVLPGATPPIPDGQWVRKPLRSAGGREICRWDEAAAALMPATPETYYQQAATGIPISALYLGSATGTVTIGVARQLVGEPELHAPQHGYCGSILPWKIPTQTQQLVEQIGQTVQAAFGLRGLFGIDFLLEGDIPWLLEINPRYTASVELWEFACQVPLLEWHCRACRGEPVAEIPPANPETCWGKVILYADENLLAPDWMYHIPQDFDLDHLPEFADLPMPGSAIFAGQPIFTCLGSGTDPAQLQADLIRRANAVLRER